MTQRNQVDLSHLDTSEARERAHKQAQIDGPVYSTETPDPEGAAEPLLGDEFRLTRAQQQARQETEMTKDKIHPDVRRSNRGIQARVLNFVQDRPGMHVNAARIAEESVGSPYGEMTHKQASNGLYQLYKKGLLEKPAEGVYFYKGTGVTPRTVSIDPSAAETGVFGRHTTSTQNGAHLFEDIGQLSDGSVVVRSDDGDLFVLVTIENHITDQISLERL